jgi:hypothetical protein
MAIECIPAMATVLLHWRRMTQHHDAQLLPAEVQSSARPTIDIRGEQYACMFTEKASSLPPHRPVPERDKATASSPVPTPRLVRPFGSNTASTRPPSTRPAELMSPAPALSAPAMLPPARPVLESVPSRVPVHAAPPARLVPESVSFDVSSCVVSSPPPRPVPETAAPYHVVSAAPPLPPPRPVSRSIEPSFDASNAPPQQLSALPHTLPGTELLPTHVHIPPCRYIRWAARRGGGASGVSSCGACVQQTALTPQYLLSLRGKFGIDEGGCSREVSQDKEHKAGTCRGFIPGTCDLTWCRSPHPVEASLRARLGSPLGTPSWPHRRGTRATLTLDEIGNAANELAGRIAATEAACGSPAQQAGNRQ